MEKNKNESQPHKKSILSETKRILHGLTSSLLPIGRTPATKIPYPHAKKKRDLAPLADSRIIILKNVRQLTVYSGQTPIESYPVAIGKPSTPTPVGNYVIANKILHPGSNLGTRWMGLNFDAYGIHGTNQPWLIGKMVSNGCIRMHNQNVERVFALVELGTPVYIRDE